MRAIKFLGSALLILVLLLIGFSLIGVYWPVSSNTHADRSLAVAGLVVAGATLASVVFAMITYVESVVLATRIENLSDEYHGRRCDAEAAFTAMKNEGRTQIFDISMIALSGLYDHAMQMSGDIPALEKIVEKIHEAEMRVHLSHGTYDSAISAIQIAMKQNPKLLLSIENSIRKICDSLKPEASAQLKKQFEIVKKRAIDLLDYYDHS